MHNYLTILTIIMVDPTLYITLKQPGLMISLSLESGACTVHALLLQCCPQWFFVTPKEKRREERQRTAVWVILVEAVDLAYVASADSCPPPQNSPQLDRGECKLPPSPTHQYPHHTEPATMDRQLPASSTLLDVFSSVVTKSFFLSQFSFSSSFL